MCRRTTTLRALRRRSAPSGNRSTGAGGNHLDGKLLTLLFEVTELFDMETRPELVMLQKTMVGRRGRGAHVNPRFQHVEASEPVVGEWIRQIISGRSASVTDLRDAVEGGVKLAEAVPEIAAEDREIPPHELLQMSENGLRFDPQTTEAIGKSEARHSRSGRIALWLIALTHLYIAWAADLNRLCVASQTAGGAAKHPVFAIWDIPLSLDVA